MTPGDGVTSIRTIFENVDRKRRNGEKVFDFSLGAPGIPFPEAEEVLYKTLENLRGGNGNRFSYTSSMGTYRARASVAEYAKNLYDTEFGFEDVVITNGTSEAGRLAMLCLKGDVIIPVPTFAPALKWSKSHKEIKTVPMREDFHLDLDKIKEALRKDNKRKIVYVPTPSNPTGVVLRDDEMNGLVDILEEGGHFLISDVVYNGIVWNNKKMPTEYMRYNNTALIDSISKRYGLAGVRSGWLVFHPDIDIDKKELGKNIVQIKEHHGYICPNVIGCESLPGLLKIDDDTLKKYHMGYERRVDILVDGLKDVAKKPDATIYLWIKSLIDNDVEFANKLINDYNVAVVPGTIFGGPGYIRFSVGGISESDIEKAMPIIRKAYGIS